MESDRLDELSEKLEKLSAFIEELQSKPAVGEGPILEILKELAAMIKEFVEEIKDRLDAIPHPEPVEG